MKAQPDLSAFMQRHALPPGYERIARQWFVPVARDISDCRQQAGRPLVVGINGSQGSGKSTLGDLLVDVLGQEHELRAVSLSIDDFCFTRAQREKCSKMVHPLLVTRGVPGTHDINLALVTLARLRHQHGELSVPRFDKANDDRFPEPQWPRLDAPLDVIILEGWCLGSHAQPDDALSRAVNELEENEDADAAWRRYVNEQLRWRYPALFAEVDVWIMLKAPSFECVFNWRQQQEEKLAGALKQEGGASSAIMNPDELKRFISHYQRITEYTLRTLPSRVHFLFELDEHREIINYTTPQVLEC